MDYSFNKKKEKDAKDAAKKLSFKDKLNIAGERFSKGAKKLRDMKETHDQKQLERLQKDIKKTKLQAQLAKNKSELEKYTKKDKSDPFDLKF